MNAIGSALRELWGLFVEDASFTIAIAAALLIAYFLFPVVSSRSEWRGATLFGLLAVVLIENVWRTARR